MGRSGLHIPVRRTGLCEKHSHRSPLPAPRYVQVCSDATMCNRQCFAAHADSWCSILPSTQVSSDDSITMARRLAVEEGVMVSACLGCGWACVGCSSVLLAGMGGTAACLCYRLAVEEGVMVCTSLGCLGVVERRHSLGTLRSPHPAATLLHRLASSATRQGNVMPASVCAPSMLRTHNTSAPPAPAAGGHFLGRRGAGCCGGGQAAGECGQDDCE